MRTGNIWTCPSLNIQVKRTKPAGLANPAAGCRTFRCASPLSKHAVTSNGNQDDRDGRMANEAKGAMSRRLMEMTEETILCGGASDAKNVEAAGFSAELKKGLESRLANSSFRSWNQRAFSVAELPSFAGKGSQAQAIAQPWTGSETLHDSALRMLDDSHKPLRGFRGPRIPQPRNLRPESKKPTSTGERLANARDKTSMYAAALANEMSDEERSQMRKELKERFSPGARPMPTTLQGLTSLANERIEDAIARGQFNNIPRGKGKNVERDYNASSPFLDTTEYFMNKIIQKQEIVPPWIEKQQELVKSVASFRGRLRNDWKRHAARMIASRGGSVESQIRTAQAYALAEDTANPVKVKVETLSKIDTEGNLSTITVQETPAAVPMPESALAERDEAAASSSSSSNISITETPPAAAAEEEEEAPIPSPSPSPKPLPVLPPFRDPTWESTEHSYHTLAVTTLNTLTRSYNLMAPRLAQKPYLNLPRELARCYADVAPLLPAEIRQRAQTPGTPHPTEGAAGKRTQGPGILSGAKWRGHEVTRFRDEDLTVKGYGFRQLFRDLFSSKKTT